MEGTQNAIVCASIGRLLIAIERERGGRLYRENDVTIAQVRERVERDRKIAEAAHYAVSNYKYTTAFAAPGVIGTAYYMLCDVHPGEAKVYMDQVCVGEELRRARLALDALTGRTHTEDLLDSLFGRFCIGK